MGDRTIRLLALSMLTGVVACTLVVAPDRKQCAKTQDCAGHGLSASAICVANVCTVPAPLTTDAAGDAGEPDALAADPIWGCLDHLPPRAAPDPTTPVRFLTRFQGILNAKPLVGLPANACLSTDVSCAQPYGPGVTSDSNGVLAFDLYHGFLGYIDVSPSANDPDIMPAIYYVQPVPDKNVAVSEVAVPSANLVTKGEFAFLSGSVGKEVKAQYGHLFFGAVNCQGTFATGTSVRSDTITSDTYTYYTDAAGTPSLTQSKTTESGNGGFINLPPGSISVTLSRENGQQVSKQDVIIRKGTITYLLIGPTPP